MKLRIFLFYSLLCLIWGTTWLVIKVSLNEGTPPLFGVGLRFLMAGVILIVIFLIKGESLPLNRRAVSIYLHFAILSFGFSYGVTYWATQYIYSNLAAILWGGFPLVVAILAHFILPDDRFTVKKIISILIGFTGIVLIFTKGKDLGGENVLVGISAIVIAVLVAAWPNIYLKKHHQAVNTLQLNTVSQTLAGLLLLLVSFCVESDQPMIWSGVNILALGYLTIFGSVITWLIYFWLFNHLPVTQISYAALIPPVIATAMGWIFLGEKFTSLAIIGAVLVLIGALLINLNGKNNLSET